MSRSGKAGNGSVLWLGWALKGEARLGIEARNGKDGRCTTRNG